MKTYEVSYFTLLEGEWVRPTIYIAEFGDEIHITLPTNANLDTVTIKEVKEKWQKP